MLPLFGFILLAQAVPSPEEAGKGVGLLERLIQGGVPLICLAIAVAAVISSIYQYRANAALEAKYRDDLEARAKQTSADADRRLAEAKTEAKERAVEVEKLQDKLRAEMKESDVTLAAATRMIEKAVDMMAQVRDLMTRIERKLDGKA
jgi:hypothetical protein